VHDAKEDVDTVGARAEGENGDCASEGDGDGVCVVPREGGGEGHEVVVLCEEWEGVCE
jgi:hypothetical protein